MCLCVLFMETLWFIIVTNYEISTALSCLISESLTVLYCFIATRLSQNRDNIHQVDIALFLDLKCCKRNVKTSA